MFGYNNTKEVAMKKIISIVLCLLATSICFAQVNQNLDGFWGIKWGADAETTRKIIEKKENCKIEQINDENILCKGKFGGEDAYILFDFYNNELYSGFVVYPYEENKTLSNYNALKLNLTKKYGQPTKDVHDFAPPYYLGDGYEETAIKVNKALFFADWIFADKNKLRLAIAKDLTIALIYQNTKILEIVSDAEHEKNMSDF